MAKRTLALIELWWSVAGILAVTAWLKLLIFIPKIVSGTSGESVKKKPGNSYFPGSLTGRLHVWETRGPKTRFRAIRSKQQLRNVFDGVWPQARRQSRYAKFAYLNFVIFSGLRHGHWRYDGWESHGIPLYAANFAVHRGRRNRCQLPVSYTHLTLPTKA